MNRTAKERVTRAYEAMEELGLDRKFITPILKELLKVYNNEWTYIEAENYRLLADQAFEQQEAVVKSQATPSPRRTRASTSAGDKGKKQIGYGNTGSPEKRTPKDAAKPSVVADGVSKPPLPATVKIEKGADRTPETLSKTTFVERVEDRYTRDDPDPLRSNGYTLNRPTSLRKIDAQTLEETLRQVANVSTEIRAETRSTAVLVDTHSVGSLLEGRTHSEASEDRDKAEHSLSKVGTVCLPVTQFPVPDSCITDITKGVHVVERAAPEPGADKSRETESVLDGHSGCSNVDEERLWHKPVKDSVNVLLLLADNYCEDEDEPKVAEISAPDSTLVQTYTEKRHDRSVLAEVGGPDSSVKELSNQERQEQPVESIDVIPEEEMPGQQLVLVLTVEDEPEHVDPIETDVVPENAVGTAERIRPRFIVNKEVPVTADDNKSVSGLMLHESGSTTSTAKRELSDPQESTQLKRVKYDVKPGSSSNLSHGCIDLHEICLDTCHTPEDEEKCTNPSGTAKKNPMTLASPGSSTKKSPVEDITGAGANRRKLILPESPSSDDSPVTNALVTGGVSESVRTNDCNTSAEILEDPEILEAALVGSTGLSITDNGTAPPSSDDVIVPQDGFSPSVVVNFIRNSVDFDDEPQDRWKKLTHLPADISRGTERVPIPYVNDYNSETIPASFKYIPVNTVFQDAYINFSLARVGEEDSCGGCFGDCLKARFPCTCTRETGGVFAYTKDGCLKEEFLLYEVDSSQNEELKEKLVTFCQSGWECPIERAKNGAESCKGHLTRKFIKECWHKCGCSLNCGNRVVQRGMTRQLQIFFTQEGKGWGLRTLEQLPPGAFVCEYVGEILTNVELDERNKALRGDSTVTYPILLDGDWCSEKGLKDEEALCLDATNFGNVARFINHRCSDANLIDVPVTIESPDRHYYHVAFFTSRAVKAMEELTWDYKLDFDDDEHPIEAFQCLCKSQFCRWSSGKKRKKRVKKSSH